MVWFDQVRLGQVKLGKATLKLGFNSTKRTMYVGPEWHLLFAGSDDNTSKSAQLYNWKTGMDK